MGHGQAMLITQHSYWAPRSLKDHFQLCHSGTLGFLQSLRLRGSLMEQQMG